MKQFNHKDYEVVCFTPQDNFISLVGENDNFDGYLQSNIDFSAKELLTKHFNLLKYDKANNYAYFENKKLKLAVLIKKYISDMDKIINS